MEKTYHDKMHNQRKLVVNNDGRTYFTKEVERRFYFFLTMFMLLLGLLAKTGLF